jgi:hypothetical protein
MLTTPERGGLVIADISGYTAYLVGTEVDHAQDVLADLSRTIVDALAPPFTFNELEGDAAFVYLLGDELDPSVVFDTLSACYGAFRTRLASITSATTCQCNACVLIPRLDLKVVAHHGQFVRGRMVGAERLTGPDVILVHRLLKNAVVAETTIAAYALFTDACLAAMAIDPGQLGFTQHRESFEGVGEVITWVDDLEARWMADQARHPVRVMDTDPGALVVASEVPADPARVWELLTTPSLRAQWQDGVTSVAESKPTGIRGVGTMNHCVHGSGLSDELIVDWRPYDYYTFRNDVHVRGLPPLLITFELEPITPERTRLRFLASRPSGPARLLWPMVTRQLRTSVDASNQRLTELLAREA